MPSLLRFYRTPPRPCTILLFLHCHTCETLPSPLSSLFYSAIFVGSLKVITRNDTTEETGADAHAAATTRDDSIVEISVAEDVSHATPDRLDVHSGLERSHSAFSSFFSRADVTKRPATHGASAISPMAQVHSNMLTGASSKKEGPTRQGPTRWYSDMSRAHDSPHHWRHKFTGFIQWHSKDLRHLVPSQMAGAQCSHAHADVEHGTQNDMGSLKGLAFYEGLDDLPHEELVFSPDHPFHPYLLYFNNNTMEVLYQKRKVRHRAQHRFYGSLLMGVLVLVAYLLDYELLASYEWSAPFRISVAVSISVQFLTAIGQLWLFLLERNKGLSFKIIETGTRKFRNR